VFSSFSKKGEIDFEGGGGSFRASEPFYNPKMKSMLQTLKQHESQFFKKLEKKYFEKAKYPTDPLHSGSQEEEESKSLNKNQTYRDLKQFFTSNRRHRE